MQYTAKKPFSSVLIIQPSSLRYRLQEDHVFKEIRYAQVRGVQIERDFYLLFFAYVVAPLQLLFLTYLSLYEGFTWPYGVELIFWVLYLIAHFFVPHNFKVVINKGSLLSEIFITAKLRQAKDIKKEIESHL